MRTTLFSALSLTAIASALPAPSAQVHSRQSGEIVTGSAAVAIVNDNDGIGAGTDTYTLHTGDGSTAAGFPAVSEWVNFLDMFNANKVFMGESCENDGWGANDSEAEITEIQNAIEAVAATTKVDHRFILATIMQESVGCVRVITTTSPDGTVTNPGLMQDHDGANSCSGVDPCPQSTVTGMVTDGTAGTSAGPGLAGLINQAQSQYGVSGAQAFYYAARLYNSGTIVDPTNLGNGDGATNCYVSDIANRLTGWVQAASTCTSTNVDV